MQKKREIKRSLGYFLHGRSWWVEAHFELVIRKMWNLDLSALMLDLLAWENRRYSSKGNDPASVVDVFIYFIPLY